MKTNRLKQEPSPYLQQHAQNPVDWYPWGKEAFAKAASEGKPILLSIGYAACHWCHVMAHESFEDEETARLMNELFVSIKVDKEERPDLDKIYQTSHYLLSRQSGGWPLTMFLTSDLIPFFSGTYFPKEEHPQRPSFKRILRLIADFYQQQAEKVQAQSQQLQKILEQHEYKAAGQNLNNLPLQAGIAALQQYYDADYGGFGQAPKFPQAIRLEYLLRNNSPMALETLQHMASGGIYDQLDGGFYRYSVDQYWNIPHFEKMLYDNGQLLALYSLAAKYYDEPSFKEIARETAEWSLQHLQAAEGGFYSSFDADSEGEEGKFYRWQREEIESLLSSDEFALVRRYYGLDRHANFEEYWHFYIAQSLESVAKQLNLELKEAEKLVASAKKKLVKARSKRAAPFRDEKILTSWNSLMIKGLMLTGEPRFIQAGQKAIKFIQDNLWQENHLFASYKDGKAYLAAYLDDYTFLLDALVTSLQVSWNSEHLLFARQLTDVLLQSFADNQDGGFFFTAKDHEKLLYRPKTMMDEAIPAGNGILVRALLVLGYLLGETTYISAAEKTLQAAWPMLTQYPAEHCSLLLGLKESLLPGQILVIRGEKDEIKDWHQEAQRLNNYCFAIPVDAANLPESLALKKVQGKSCAYLCRGLHCEAVITSKSELKARLAS
ncbi:Thioredoxin-related protein [Legionella massiliensis]|uniref:Thioredoxin-related protein n=1 Tax=Legionella massiliensis TaxID=1034943 RepID=A0A078L0Y6_9GAMM|nr:thioredoxin domain-containing protein [Legionella massiliensis]CDZ77699.1 Thioredoxin-related protein [Legionella massiliensis]CEE13437.1 hypothetical protein BN1094_01989 [Legionella massiliensis]